MADYLPSYSAGSMGLKVLASAALTKHRYFPLSKAQGTPPGRNLKPQVEWVVRYVPDDTLRICSRPWHVVRPSAVVQICCKVTILPPCAPFNHIELLLSQSPCSPPPLYLISCSRLQILLQITSPVPFTRMDVLNCISVEQILRELLTATGNCQDVRNSSQAP